MPITKKANRWKDLQFVSTLPAGKRKAVEELFFMNPRQRPLVPSIKAAVEKTGVPAIVQHADRICLAVPSGSMQCLFACDKKARPIAVALYGRPERDILWISHLAIDPSCSANDSDGTGLAGVVVGKIREIAHRIEGVSRLQLPYRRASFLPVR